MIRITQGFTYRHKVKSIDSKMVIKSDASKIILQNPVIEGEDYFIQAEAVDTAHWESGPYKFQVLNSQGIEQQGDLQVIRNYYLTDDVESVRSRNEQLLEAIEDQIAGKATSLQSSMTVGDKSIGYCSIDQLFKLRDHFKKKVAEEKGSKIVDGNQMIIKHKWSLR